MKIVWFRRDLRIDDNTALTSAIDSGEAVIALYVATPDTWRAQHHSPIQADLIFRRLAELKRDLEQLGIPLYYTQVDTFTLSAELVAQLADEINASAIYFNKEYEWNEVQRDKFLYRLLIETSLDYCACDDKCIFTPGSVRNKQGDYFKVFTPFKRAYLTKLYQTQIIVHKAVKTNTFSYVDSTLVTLFDESVAFDYPRESSVAYPVTRDEILHQLRGFVAHQVDQYAEQRDFPAKNATSVLSCYLAIGALSVRQCMARLMYQQSLPLTTGREVWQSELIWREFYQHLIYFQPRLSKGDSFVVWGDNLIWRNIPSEIKAWKLGKTGYPIVDAAMVQLNQTGWMHNRLRMIVASFLVKDLLVDWRIGEAYFMQKLVDGDYAANNGGWQWCASTGCDSQPYFRIFNPITQGEKFDPHGTFVRQWLPELKSVPDKYIHQPWKWERVKALSYPAPIVDHKVQRTITLAHYKNAKDVLNAT